jgi:hypothetical protein
LARFWGGWKNLLRSVAIAAAILTGIIFAAWRWDPHLLHDTLSATTNRPLVGISNIARLALGPLGIILLLLVCACLEWFIAAFSKFNSQADTIAILLALSVIPITLGGPYASVYTFPLLIRLARRLNSPTFFLLYYSAFYALLMLAAWLTSAYLQNFIITPLLAAVYIFFPIIVAIGGSLLLFRNANSDAAGIIPLPPEGVSEQQ